MNPEVIIITQQEYKRLENLYKALNKHPQSNGYVNGVMEYIEYLEELREKYNAKESTVKDGVLVLV